MPTEYTGALVDAPKATPYEGPLVSPTSGVLQETAKAVPRVIGGIAQEAGEAAQYLTGDRVGRGVRRYGEKLQADNAMTPGFVKDHPVISQVGEAAEGVAKMAPYVAAAAIPGAGAPVMLGVLPAVMGAAQGQRSYESAKAQGMSSDEALKASYLPAAVTTAGMAAMGPATRGVRAVLPKALDVTAARAAGQKLLKPVVADLAAGTAAGTAVMQAQAAGTAQAEKISGARPDADPWKEVIANPKAWVGAALAGGMFEAAGMLGPRGKLAQGERLKQALNHPEVPKEVKAQIILGTTEEIRKTDPAGADAYRAAELAKLHAGEELDTAPVEALLPKEEAKPVESAKEDLISAVADSVGRDETPLEVLQEKAADAAEAHVEEKLAPHAEAAQEAALSPMEKVMKMGGLTLKRGEEPPPELLQDLAGEGKTLVKGPVEKSGSVVRHQWELRDLPPVEAEPVEAEVQPPRAAEEPTTPAPIAQGEQRQAYDDNPNLMVKRLEHPEHGDVIGLGDRERNTIGVAKVTANGKLGEWLRTPDTPEERVQAERVLRRHLGEAARFNTEEAPKGPALPKADIEAHLADAIKGLKTPVEIVDKAVDIPGLSTDVPFNGVFHNGKIYLNAEHISSLDEAKRVLLEHEIAHSGLRGMLGKDFDSVLAKAWGSRDEAVRAFAKERGIDISTKAGKLEATEEYIVSLAEHGAKNAIWTKFVSVVREWLRKAGIDLKFTDADLREMVLRARAFEREGDSGTVFSKLAEATQSISEDPAVTGDLPKFNRLTPEVATRSVSELSDAAFKSKEVLKYLGNRAYRFVFPEDRIIKAALGTYRFTPIHKPLTDLARYKQEMQGAATDISHRTHTNADEFRKVFASPELADKAARLAFLETVYQLDGTMPLEGQWVPEMVDVPDTHPNAPEGATRQVERGVWQAPKVEGFAMAETLEEAYAEVKAAERALGEHAPKVRKLQDHVKEAAEQRIAALKEKNNFLFGEGSEEAIAANESIDRMARLKGRYMPLTRFGDHLVRVFDGERHVRTESFESRSKAVEYVAQMRAEGKKADIETKAPHDFKDVSIPASFLDQIQRAAEEQGLTGESLDRFVAEYKKQWAATLPDSSLRVNDVRRSNMAGFDTNLLRVYENHMQKFAHAVPKIKYGVRIESAFRDMRNAVKAEGMDQTADPRTAQEMFELHNALYERQHVGDTERINGLVRGINKAVFLNYLATPSTWLVQWSQPFVMTIPKLAARHGAKTSAEEFARGARDYFRGKVSDEKIQAFDEVHGGLGTEMLSLMDKLRLTVSADEQAALRREMNQKFTALSPEEQTLLISKMMILRGGNDLAFSHDVADDIAGASKVDRGLNKLVEKGGVPMRLSETGSRRAANLAAFRMEFAKSGDFAKASDYAMDIIDDTLYNFGSENRAGWMRGNAGRLIGMFQYFRLHTVAKEMQLVRDAIGSQHNEAIRAAGGDQAKLDAANAAKLEARKELAYQMGVTMMLSGAAGTPLAMLASNTVTNTLWAALQYLFGDPDDPMTLEQMAEAKTREMFGDEAGTVLSKGVLSLVNADISRRVGMGGMANLVPGDPPPGLSGTKRMQWYSARILGPSWGMLTDQVRAMDAFAEGDMGAAFKYSSPKVVKDLMKAYNLNEEGVSAANGKTVLPPEMVSTSSIVLQMVGINPMEVSLAQETAREVSALSTTLSQRRSKLIKAFEKAQAADDYDGRDEALQAISEWGGKNPRLAISQKELAAAVKRGIEKRMGIPSKRERLAEEMLEGDM